MTKNIARGLLIALASVGILSLAGIPIYISWQVLGSFWKALGLGLATMGGIAGLLVILVWAIDRVDWD